jgi:hypothetical protein
MNVPLVIPATADVIATVRSSEDMVDALRAIKTLLGLSNEFCDQIGGLSSGHTDKILGPTRAKNLGPMTFDLFCELFAVEFRMHINIDAAKRMAERWEGREMRNVRIEPNRVSKVLLQRAKSHVLKASGQIGGMVRNEMLTPKHRKDIASKAAKARWRKHRKTKREMRINSSALPVVAAPATCDDAGRGCSQTT